MTMTGTSHVRAYPSGSSSYSAAEGRAGSVLVVDDDESMCELAAASLHRVGYTVTTTTSAIDALQRLESEQVDVIVTDLNMAELNGFELCARILDTTPDVAVVVMTAHGSMETAVGAIRARAYDFLTKPVDMRLLSLTVGRAIRQRRLREEVRRLRDGAADPRGQSALVGRSPALRTLFDLVGRVAQSDAAALIVGESGTGKELVARAIHEQSSRAHGPFVALNCAAVPAALLESELFGHAKGAFTDAKATRRGLFVEANGGTLFLDEIGELPLDVQPKLLRALQERSVRPVGGNAEQPFDARIITATNRDLESEIRNKRFREDLFYRINVVSVEAPPLRARGGDILVLAQHFVERFAPRRGEKVKGISASAAEKLMAYRWPGNVRELENCIERAVALARFDVITVEDLPEKVRGYGETRGLAASEEETELVTVDELERRYIRRVMTLVHGNKSRAAHVLGLDRRTLYRKLEGYQDIEAAWRAEKHDAEPAAVDGPAA